jgi:hypothetical protein
LRAILRREIRKSDLSAPVAPTVNCFKAIRSDGWSRHNDFGENRGEQIVVRIKGTCGKPLRREFTIYPSWNARAVGLNQQPHDAMLVAARAGYAGVDLLVRDLVDSVPMSMTFASA